MNSLIFHSIYYSYLNASITIIYGGGEYTFYIFIYYISIVHQLLFIKQQKDQFDHNVK